MHAAKRFFKKAFKASHSAKPRVVNVDKNPAYSLSMEELKTDGVLLKDCKLCQVKHLNNIVEQDHRFIKRVVNSGLGFSSFNIARRTLKGYEAMHMNRKGQIEGVEKGDIWSQGKVHRKTFRNLCLRRGK